MIWLLALHWALGISIGVVSLSIIGTRAWPLSIVGMLASVYLIYQALLIGVQP